jgi:hypothetical protein
MVVELLNHRFHCGILNYCNFRVKSSVRIIDCNQRLSAPCRNQLHSFLKQLLHLLSLPRTLLYKLLTRLIIFAHLRRNHFHVFRLDFQASRHIQACFVNLIIVHVRPPSIGFSLRIYGDICNMRWTLILLFKI